MKCDEDGAAPAPGRPLTPMERLAAMNRGEAAATPAAAPPKAARRAAAPDAGPAAEKKKKRVAAATAGHIRNSDVPPDPGFAAMADLFRKEGGALDLATPDEADAMVTGIPLPALSARYMFRQTVMPIGRHIMLYGKFGTAKSALLTEFERWSLLNSGLVLHIDNENKDSPDLRIAQFYRNPEHRKRMGLTKASSQQEWFDTIVRWKDAYDAMYRRKVPAKRDVKQRYGESAAELRERSGPKVLKGKPGYIYPLFMGLDSLVATATEKTIDGIETEGTPKLAWNEEANLLTKYAKALSRFFLNRPGIFCMTNHLKEKSTAQGLTVDQIPGGLAMQYMVSTMFKTEKILQFKTVDHSGIRLRITTTKNSLGEGGGKVVVDFKWWYVPDPATGLKVQRAAWDWDAATVDLLCEIGKGSAGVRDAIADVVDLNVSSGRKVWSKALGIPASKPVLYTVAGAMIERDGTMIAQLHDILHIKARTPFMPGVEYGEHRKHAAAAAGRERSIYATEAASGLADTAFIDEELDRAALAAVRPASSACGGDDDEYDEPEE